MRNDIKELVKTAISGVSGIAAVYTHRPKIQNQFPAVVIHLPKADETRVSASAPIGKKKVVYTAQLEVFTIDQTPDGSGQVAFEDILDEIDIALRADPQFGGAVLAAGVEYIKTVVAPPQLVNGQNIAILAVKTFDITVMVTG
jgi:hypothetical protein